MNRVLRALKAGSKSRRTATAGVLLAVASICTGLAYTIDVDPDTKADWNLVAVMVISAITAVSAWLSKDEDDDPEPDHRSNGAKPK